MCLSPRELQCLAGVASGRPDTETALELAISVPTVKFHVHNAIRKLRSRNRCEAVYRAAKLQLI